MRLPLAGVRVLSSARYLPAGYCTMLLADSGAEVIMLEQLRQPADERVTNPAAFKAVNVNKKSITLNLRSDEGKEICHRLVQQSDVFIDGYRPGVAARLGVDYKTLSGINPKIVYISISGFGQDGPYRLKAGHDLTYQGISGMLAAMYSEEKRGFSPSLTGLGDIVSGMLGTVSILTALYDVKRGGKGQYLDLSMVDGMLSWLSVWLSEEGRFKAIIQDYGYDIYPTRDGKYITLSMVNEDHFWRNLCKAIDREDMAELSIPERESRNDELAAMLKETFLTKTRDEWVKILEEADVPSGPAYTLAEEVFNDPQIRHRDMVREEPAPGGDKTVMINSPLKFQDTPRRAAGSLPGLGEHTREILAQLLGLTDEELDRLRDTGVI